MVIPLRGSSGTSSVEFALVLPLLLILLLGAVETGLMLLSYASMNTTMSMVQDLGKTASSAQEFESGLDAIAELNLGFGFAEISFEPVAQLCVCPQDAVVGLELRAVCPIFCADGADPLRVFDVTGRVTVPSVSPGRPTLGAHTVEVHLTVLGR